MISPRIVVAHGYLASPEKHWFPWLREQYGADVVTVPALPDPSHPQLDRWVHALGSAIGAVDENTILVGHSLGSITTLRVLDALPGSWTLGGLVIVSGFAEPLPNLPKLDAFTAAPLDLDVVVARTGGIHVIGSDDDTTVAPPLTARLAARLDAPLTIVPGGGHFVERQGCRSLPAILPVIDGLIG